MKTNVASKRDVKNINAGDIREASISEDFGQTIAHILTNIYKNKLIFIREIMSNAWDAHVEAGNKSTPIVISAKTTPSTTRLEMQDYGTGMNPEKFHRFASYGQSDKNHTDDFIGGFGIGSKSIYAVDGVTTFQVETVVDGIKYKYFCFLNENSIPAYKLINKEDTTQRNGTLITIDVPKTSFSLEEIKSECKHSLIYFDNLIFEGELSELNKKYKIHDYKDFLICEVDRYNYGTFSTKNNNDKILIGQVPYDINPNSLSKLSKEQLSFVKSHIVRFDVSELKPSPNREDYVNTREAHKIIVNKIDHCIKLKESIINKKIPKVYDAIIEDFKNGIFNPLEQVGKYDNLGLFNYITSKLLNSPHYYYPRSISLKYLTNIDKISFKSNIDIYSFKIVSLVSLFENIRLPAKTIHYNGNFKNDSSIYLKAAFNNTSKVVIYDNFPSGSHKKNYLKSNYQFFIKKSNLKSLGFSNVNFQDKKRLLKLINNQKWLDKKQVLKIFSDLNDIIENLVLKSLYKNANKLSNINFPDKKKVKTKLSYRVSYLNDIYGDNLDYYRGETIDNFLITINRYKRTSKRNVYLALYDQKDTICRKYFNIPIIVVFLSKSNFKNFVQDERIMNEVKILTDFHTKYNRDFSKYATRLILDKEENKKVINWFRKNSKFFNTSKYNYFSKNYSDIYYTTKFIDKRRNHYNTDSMRESIINIAMTNKYYDHDIIAKFKNLKKFYNMYSEYINMLNVDHEKKEKVFCILFNHFKKLNDASN